MKKVYIFYDPISNTIELALWCTDFPQNWWKYFEIHDDFIHMDFGPLDDAQYGEIIGTFEMPENETLMGTLL